MADIQGALHIFMGLAALVLEAGASYSYTKFERPDAKSILYRINHLSPNKPTYRDNLERHSGIFIRLGDPEEIGHLRQVSPQSNAGEMETKPREVLGLNLMVPAVQQVAASAEASKGDAKTEKESSWEDAMLVEELYKPGRLAFKAWTPSPWSQRTTHSFSHLVHHDMSHLS